MGPSESGDGGGSIGDAGVIGGSGREEGEAPAAAELASPGATGDGGEVGGRAGGFGGDGIGSSVPQYAPSCCDR